MYILVLFIGKAINVKEYIRLIELFLALKIF